MPCSHKLQYFVDNIMFQNYIRSLFQARKPTLTFSLTSATAILATFHRQGRLTSLLKTNSKADSLCSVITRFIHPNTSYVHLGKILSRPRTTLPIALSTLYRPRSTDNSFIILDYLETCRKRGRKVCKDVFIVM